LIVEDPDDRNLLFRFYDPRVLPNYLETCNSAECARFFGPTRSFFASGKGECINHIQPVVA